MSAVQAVNIPVYGQPIRFSGSIVTTTTGNPITGGLTVLTASASIDGAAFVANTGLTVAEIGTTGYFTLDVDATRMTGNTIILKVTASNVNAREWAVFIYPADLRETVGQWQDATVKRFEQGVVQNSASAFNLHTLSQSTETVYARDSSTAIITGTVSGLQSPGGTVTRNKMA